MIVNKNSNHPQPLKHVLYIMNDLKKFNDIKNCPLKKTRVIINDVTTAMKTFRADRQIVFNIEYSIGQQGIL